MQNNLVFCGVAYSGVHVVNQYAVRNTWNEFILLNEPSKIILYSVNCRLQLINVKQMWIKHTVAKKITNHPRIFGRQESHRWYLSTSYPTQPGQLLPVDPDVSRLEVDGQQNQPLISECAIYYCNCTFSQHKTRSTIWFNKYFAAIYYITVTANWQHFF